MFLKKLFFYFGLGGYPAYVDKYHCHIVVNDEGWNSSEWTIISQELRDFLNDNKISWRYAAIHSVRPLEMENMGVIYVFHKNEAEIIKNQYRKLEQTS